MDIIRTILCSKIAEAVVQLIDTLHQTTETDQTDNPYQQYGLVREQYGLICGLSMAAELAGVDYSAVQAVKDRAATSKRTCWADVLDTIQY